MGIVLLGEGFSVSIGVGTSLVFLGILAVALSGPSGGQGTVGRSVLLKGLGFGLGGSVAWSLAWVASRVAVIDLGSALLAALIGYILSILVQGGILIFKGGFRLATGAGKKQLLFLLSSGIATAFGYMFYYLSLGILPIVLVVPIASLSPIVATLGSFLLIQRIEKVNLRVVLATILAFSGVYLVIFS